MTLTCQFKLVDLPSITLCPKNDTLTIKYPFVPPPILLGIPSINIDLSINRIISGSNNGYLYKYLRTYLYIIICVYIKERHSRISRTFVIMGSSFLVWKESRIKVYGRSYFLRSEKPIYRLKSQSSPLYVLLGPH